MTRKLYYEDSRLAVFDGRVLSCIMENDSYLTVLDRTAFFPEGGGQPGDTGRLGEATVIDTKEINGEIVHFCDAPLRTGATVRGEIDFAKRFARMQNHSGEHIVSGIIHALFGFDNVGFHMGHDDITMDYNGVLDRNDILKAERLANEVVYANVDITARFPDRDELKSLKYRSKLDLTENVRIVTVEGCDVCACCAPHVSKSGEIGIIKLLDFARYKGGVRVHMLCGTDALRDYNAKYRDIRDIAGALSVKQSEAAAAVKRQLDEANELKKRISVLKNELLSYKLNELTPTEGNVCIFDDSRDAVYLRRLAAAGADICGGMAAVFGGEECDYSYVIISRKVDLKVRAAEINAAISGRGGGSSEMISGKAFCSRKTAEKYFL